MKKFISKKNLLLVAVVAALLAIIVNTFLCRVLGNYDTAQIINISLLQDGSRENITDSLSDETKKEILRVLNSSFGIQARVFNEYAGDRLNDVYIEIRVHTFNKDGNPIHTIMLGDFNAYSRLPYKQYNIIDGKAVYNAIAELLYTH